MRRIRAATLLVALLLLFVAFGHASEFRYSTRSVYFWSTQRSGLVYGPATVGETDDDSCCQTTSRVDVGEILTTSTKDTFVVVTNCADSSLTLTYSLKFGSHYVITDADPTGVELAAGESDTCDLQFDPASAGTKYDTLFYNVDICYRTVLEGDAVNAASCSIDVDSLKFLNTELYDSEDETLTVYNTAAPPAQTLALDPSESGLYPSGSPFVL